MTKGGRVISRLVAEGGTTKGQPGAPAGGQVVGMTTRARVASTKRGTGSLAGRQTWTRGKWRPLDLHPAGRESTFQDTNPISGHRWSLPSAESRDAGHARVLAIGASTPFPRRKRQQIVLDISRRQSHRRMRVLAICDISRRQPNCRTRTGPRHWRFDVVPSVSASEDAFAPPEWHEINSKNRPRNKHEKSRKNCRNIPF